MAVNQQLVDAMNKYHTAKAYSPAVDIIKGITIAGSVWMKYREDQRKKTEKALEEYIIDDAPSGIDHWNEEGIDVITGRLTELKNKQDMYMRSGNKAGAIRVFKEAEKIMTSVNKLSGIFAKYKTQSDGVDGIQTMFSNVSNNDLINQLVNGDGNYTVFFEGGDLKIQTFTDDGSGNIILGDPLDLNDVADSVFLKANDVGGKIVTEIARIAGTKNYERNKGQLKTYLSQTLDNKSTLFSMFWDDVLPLSDGGMNSLTLADEYKKEHPNFDITQFDPRSAAYQNLNPEEQTAILKIMKGYAINKIMGMSKTFYNANAANQGNTTVLFTKETEMTLDDGTKKKVTKKDLNNVLGHLRNPVDKNSFKGWDGHMYTYYEDVDKWHNETTHTDHTADEVAGFLDFDSHDDIWKGTSGSSGLNIGF